MIPISDDNPTRITPVVTWLIVAACVAVFLWEISLGKAMDGMMRDASLARAVGLNGETVTRLWSAFQTGAPGLYWSRVWTLYILMRWCHRHNVLA